MTSSRMIGRLMLAGIHVGAVLWSAGPSAADPMRLRLENLTTGVGVIITDNGAATFSDTQAVATPQAGTMVLLGVGLIVLAVLPVLRRAARRQRGS